MQANQKETISTEPQEGLFFSVDDCLRFAYRYRVEQYQRAMADSKPNPDGKGLVGLDGAAQAGLITGMVRRWLSQQQALIIKAMYMPQETACKACGGATKSVEWRGLIVGIATLLQREIHKDKPERLLADLTERQYSLSPVRLMEIADRYGLTEDKAKKLSSEVKGYLSKEQKRAMAKLKVVFEQAGFVEVVGKE